MKIIVVGGGIFGCVIASDLAKRGHSVTLYEKNREIMMETSWVNQYRVHRGYHYPRSKKTILECKAAAHLFEKRYNKSINNSYKNLYAIADHNSRISFEEYLNILSDTGLEYQKLNLEDTVQNTDGVIMSRENLFNPFILRDLVKTELSENKVNLKLGEMYNPSMKNFDKLIVCTYSHNNEILAGLGYAENRLKRIQVVEKPIVHLPEKLKKLSIVMMDGEYFSCDPFSGTENSLLGHVRHAVHLEEFHSEISSAHYEFLEYVRSNKVSNYCKMKDSIASFIPEFAEAEYRGSMYTIRVVYGDVSKTDERPSNFVAHSNRVGSIFSGKIPTSVSMINDVCDAWKDV